MQPIEAAEILRRESNLRSDIEMPMAMDLGAEAIELIAAFDADLRTMCDGAQERIRNDSTAGEAHGMEAVLDHWDRLRAARKSATGGDREGRG